MTPTFILFNIISYDLTYQIPVQGHYDHQQQSDWAVKGSQRVNCRQPPVVSE